MTIETLFPELEVVSNTSQKFSSETQTQLDGVLSKITGVLSLESKQELKEKNEKMKDLLKELQEAIQKRREKIGYDYEQKSYDIAWCHRQSNYEARLCQSDEFLEKVFEEKVLWNGNENNIFWKIFKRENKLKKIYETILSILPDKWKEIILKKIKEEYFEDIIYESIPNDELKLGKVMSVEFGFDLPKVAEDVSVLFFDRKIDESILENILHAKKIRSILFKENSLLVDKEILKKLFKNLKNIRSFSISKQDVSSFDTETLEMIFTYCKNLKQFSINRYNNYRDDNIQLENTHLEIIFQNLRNIKKLDISGFNLWGFSSNSLEIIFAWVQNVENINLSNNNLSQLNWDDLEIIFSHLQHIKTINLSHNRLWELDQQKLSIIFSNLQNASNIHLSNNSFTEEQQKHIQNLFPNWVVRFR